MPAIAALKMPFPIISTGFLSNSVSYSKRYIIDCSLLEGPPGRQRSQEGEMVLFLYSEVFPDKKALKNAHPSLKRGAGPLSEELDPSPKKRG